MKNRVTEGQSAPDEQIDLQGSPLRKAGLLALSIGFVVLCVFMLVVRPEAGGRSIAAGSLAEFVFYAGIVVFGGFAAIIAAKFFRRGPVFSVGTRGIFDRRLSSDWIPWSAIHGIGSAELTNQRWLSLHLDPMQEASLPILKRAKFLKRQNEKFGFPGYAVSASELRGGFQALTDAVRRMQPPVR